MTEAGFAVQAGSLAEAVQHVQQVLTSVIHQNRDLREVLQADLLRNCVFSVSRSHHTQAKEFIKVPGKQTCTVQGRTRSDLAL